MSEIERDYTKYDGWKEDVAATVGLVVFMALVILIASVI